MADLAELKVSLELQTAAFQAGARQVDSRLKKMETGFKSASVQAGKMEKAMGSIAKKFIALAAVNFSASFIKGTIEANSLLAKTARTLGLTSTQFQELSFAAERSGINASQFASNMTAFVKRVGEAQNGMGPLVSGLKNLDKQLLENIKNAPNQAAALGIVAEAVKNAGSAAEKAAITNAAFSRSGVAMSQMLEGGAEGLQAMADEANKLGIVIDGKLLTYSEALDDKLLNLSKTMKNNFASAVLSVAKNAEAFVKDFRDSEAAMTALQVAGVAFGGMIIAKLIPSIKALTVAMAANPIGALVVAFTAGTVYMIANWEEFKEVFEDGLYAIQIKAAEFGVWWSQLIIDAKEFFGGTATNGQIEELERTQAALKNIKSEYDGVTEARKKALEEQNAEKVKAAVGALDDTAENAKKARQKLLDLAATLGDTQRPWDVYARKLEQIRAAYAEAEEGTFDLEKAVASLQDEFLKPIEVKAEPIKLKTDANSIKTVTEELKDAVNGFTSDFTNNLVDGLMKGELSFKKFGQSVIATMAKIVLNKQFEAFFEMIANMIPTFGGGTGTTGTGGGGGHSRASSFSGLKHQQVTRAGMPSGGGRSYGGGAPNIQIYNNAAADTDVKVETTNNQGDISITIERMVNDVISSGGADGSMGSRFGAQVRAY